MLVLYRSLALRNELAYPKKCRNYKFRGVATFHTGFRCRYHCRPHSNYDEVLVVTGFKERDCKKLQGVCCDLLKGWTTGRPAALLAEYHTEVWRLPDIQKSPTSGDNDPTENSWCPSASVLRVPSVTWVSASHANKRRKHFV